MTRTATATATSSAGSMAGMTRPDDHVIVMFGATGDLAKRKLLPGLFHLATSPSSTGSSVRRRPRTR